MLVRGCSSLSDGQRLLRILRFLWEVVGSGLGRTLDDTEN